MPGGSSDIHTTSACWQWPCRCQKMKRAPTKLLFGTLAYVFSITYIVWMLFHLTISSSQYRQADTVDIKMPYEITHDLDSLSLKARANQEPYIQSNSELRMHKYNIKMYTDHVFDESYKSNESMIRNWESKQTQFCGGKFIGYANRFVQNFDIILDPRKVSGASGGEKLTTVLRQKETNEFLTAKPGLFAVDCAKVPKYRFEEYLGVTRGYIPSMLRYTIPMSKFLADGATYDVEDRLTFIVMRYDYANLFHALNDVFNVFLLHVFLHKNPKESNILIIDGHPQGHVDPVWSTLFRNVARVRHLEKPIMYKNMVWNMFEKWCPLNDHSLSHVPHLDDFRTFMLQSYGIIGKPKAECSDKMSVLFVWRRNYLAHPRNPTGRIDRKIKNEDELLAAVQRKYPGFRVVGSDLASVDFKQQLQLVANTDIIIGMHGAGLSHMLFMPYNGGLIELMQYRIPVKDIKPRLVFKTIGRWKNFSVLYWQNKDKGHDLRGGYTYVPPDAVLGRVDQVISMMCNQE